MFWFCFKGSFCVYNFGCRFVSGLMNMLKYINKFFFPCRSSVLEHFDFIESLQVQASLTQLTWVWADSRRWWRTGKLVMLHFMGSQRVRPDWTTEQHRAFRVDTKGQTGLNFRGFQVNRVGIVDKCSQLKNIKGLREKERDILSQTDLLTRVFILS